MGAKRGRATISLRSVTTICLPTPDALDYVGELPDGVEVLVWDAAGEPPLGIENVEFFVGRYDGIPASADALARMPHMQVLQLASAGVDAWLPVVPTGVILCNGRGVHGASTAELAVAGMLAVLRQVPHFVGAQGRHEWQWRQADGLTGKRVLIIGAGDIGQRIADAIRPFDAVPTLVARTARDGVLAIDAIDEQLRHHDVVVIAVPHTPQTHHLVDAAFLAEMPDGAVLVNIARGGIVDTDALVAEVTRGRLRAYLDVTDPEPLPTGHPLWNAPNVFITPHVGGGTAGWQQRAYTLVREQIERYVRGEPLVNVVTKGY
jgi:phosphoglycerate dehydrogenase-like enzyme